MKTRCFCFLLSALITVRSTSGTFIDIQKIQLNDYDTPITIALNATTEYIIQYPLSNTTNPYRVKTWSNDSSLQSPILVVVRQARQVTSWKIPMLIETSRNSKILQFYNVSRIMCHDHMDQITGYEGDLEASTLPLIFAQNFIVAVSTSSESNVTINIDLEEVTDFYVNSDTNYSLSVSPSSSRYVFYRFDSNETEAVTIIIDSLDDICLTVSVQDSMCPVLDSNKDVKYEGTYETINRKGALTIKNYQYKFGFFLVFVAKPDDYECSEDRVVIPRGGYSVLKTASTTTSSTVTFTISRSITAKQYMIACLSVLGILICFGMLFTIASLIINRFGTISKNKFVPIKIKDYIEPLTEDQISKILTRESLTVDVFAKYPKRIKKRSYNYLSHIMSIALFYSIPVIQLVGTYQRVVNVSGDLDLCYYNFLCAHPALGFSDFNHLYSNIGYVLIGIFFIFAVIDRHTMIKITKDQGIPVHYGLFHAMGVALIIEGLLSACYHICPSQSNYQFDTSFMYIMAVLIMVKLYQNRHPDINATAYSTFTVLGLAIFLATVGILDGTLFVWVTFFICYTILLVLLSLKIYYVSFVYSGVAQLKHIFKTVGFCKEMFHPIRKGRFILLLIINGANFGMLGVGLWLYISGSTDFGTFLLGLLMGNTVIHCSFYTTMKILHKEKICYESIVYGILGVACWVASGVFFLDAATLWTVSPAESRQWNQGCIFLSFFDKHDVWHLLSAPALYFTFMYLMYLDDDIAGKKQSEIPVF